jgi:hypothetical protein
MKTCRICGEQKSPSEFEKGRRVCKDCRNKQNAAARYKVTVGEVDALRKECGDKCMICDTPAEDIEHGHYKTNKLVIDHCHETEKVRGLLCPTCNAGLGHFRDNPVLLAKAISYLTERG